MSLVHKIVALELEQLPPLEPCLFVVALDSGLSLYAAHEICSAFT